MSRWIFDTENALLWALKTSTAPVLLTLEMPRYTRELRTRVVDETIVLELDKRGYRRYKRRYPRPCQAPPPANTEGIKSALNHVLPSPFKVVEVTDEGNHVIIIMEEKNEKSERL